MKRDSGRALDTLIVEIQAEYGRDSRTRCDGRELCVFVLGSAAIAAEGDGSYQVEFEAELSKGTVDTFTVEVYPKWAPLGAVRFKEIIEAEIWKSARFFRVVSGFMVQWGIPASQLWWRSENKIKDDPVTASNTRGMITFATSGKDLADNAGLHQFCRQYEPRWHGICSVRQGDQGHGHCRQDLFGAW